MTVKRVSRFKNPEQDHQYFREWVKRLETLNGRTYEAIEISTSLGKTQVWLPGPGDVFSETLVVFPGARTTSLVWDLDRGLDHLGQNIRVFLVETNGLPNLSDGNTPDIRSLDYGYWAGEVLNGLEVATTFVAGASFGGLICMKLGITHPEKVKAAFLLNPACLQSFSLLPTNLFYNLLPMISPTQANVKRFLDKAVFSKPHHALSRDAEQMLVDYEVFALTRYIDRTQKPYYMGNELEQAFVDTYLVEGDSDLLFPYRKSIENARNHLKRLKDVTVLHQAGHGIETFSEAIRYIGDEVGKIQSGHGAL